MARNPGLDLDKLVPGLGAEVKARGGSIPVASNAVVFGLVVIPVLIQWCYRTLTYAIRLRAAVWPLVANVFPPCPEVERLALPLGGSLVGRGRFSIERLEAALALLVAGALLLVCGAMLLWDYSHKFSFDPVSNLDRFNGPFRLWTTSPAGHIVRPQAFDSVATPYHPALLPPWQPWAYLALLVWSGALVYDAYRQLGVWAARRHLLPSSPRSNVLRSDDPPK